MTKSKIPGGVEGALFRLSYGAAALWHLASAMPAWIFRAEAEVHVSFLDGSGMISWRSGMFNRTYVSGKGHRGP